jgi:serine protease Do
LGVVMVFGPACLAWGCGVARPRGALVQRVEAGGPAEAAGVKSGDVILGVNGQNIDHFGDLTLLISNLHPGAEARITIWRAGKTQDINVKIAVVTDEQQPITARAPKSGAGAGQPDRLGLRVRVLTADEKHQAQTDGSLVIENVSGPAAAAGLQPNDIILGINTQRVHTIQELVAAAKAAGKTVALLIQREDRQIFYPLHLN